MPEIIFKADQGAGVRKIIRIMQGDTRSHIIRFVVPRYAAGVDLAPLIWYIKFVDAEKEPDIAMPAALYEVTEDEIRVRWMVDGVPANVVGSTRFQLFGAGEDANGEPVSWKSGIGEIEITENLDFYLSDDREEKVNKLDELIRFASRDLNDLTNKANALATTAVGKAVEIFPDEGSILKPVLQFGPNMTGDGPPSPTNVRRITARSGGTLTFNGEDCVVNFGRSVYGCTVDWNEKIMRVDTAMIELTGEEIGGQSAATGGTADVVMWAQGAFQNEMPVGDYMDGWCSHFYNERSGKNINTVRFGASNRTVFFYLSTAEFANVAALKSYIASEKALGRPVQLVYPLANPATVLLNNAQLNAIAGINTLHTDAEEMTVVYNRSLAKTIEELRNAIIAMGGNV